MVLHRPVELAALTGNWEIVPQDSTGASHQTMGLTTKVKLLRNVLPCSGGCYISCFKGFNAGVLYVQRINWNGENEQMVKSALDEDVRAIDKFAVDCSALAVGNI